MKKENIWEDKESLREIKNLFCKSLTDGEFETFKGIGKATGLNPYLRELWAIKYPEKEGGYKNDAKIFIGRDGYRKAAQTNPEYDYHQVDAIYENDTFIVKGGEIEHSYSLKDRGKIYGAYCIVKRKGASKATYHQINFKEYYLGNKDSNGNVIITKGGYEKKETLWDTKEATMAKKVAEAQALRGAFQEIFAGTYDESEKWKMEDDGNSASTVGEKTNTCGGLPMSEKTTDFETAKQKLLDSVSIAQLHYKKKNEIDATNMSKEEKNELNTVFENKLSAFNEDPNNQ